MSIRKNDDIELVELIEQKLKENDGYCPCKLDKIPENKCICKEFLEQPSGLCHCGRYIKY